MPDNKSIRIAYIGGGSMNYCWKFISEMASEELSGTVLLYDIDKQLSLANEVIGNRLREQEDNKSDIIYLATDTIEEAVKGADFVILALTVGTLDNLINDISIPEKYGIVQAEADTSGPGGMMRALRTIPVYMDIAETIKKYAPDAWVINVTNPMDVCLMTLKHVFPEIKAFGSTNESFAAEELIADFVSKEANLPHVHRREIKTNLVGINGFSWFTEVNYHGDDIMDVYRRFNKNFAEMGYERHTGEYKSNPKASGNMVKFDMFLRYGAIAAADDRHIADHCPPWYLSTMKNAASWKIGMMNQNYLKRLKVEKTASSKKLMNGDQTVKIGTANIEIINQIKALMGLKNLITNVDIENKGQASNLPLGSIVQTNALFSHNSVRPVMSGALPEELTALTMRHISNEKTLLASAVEKDLDIAFNAFLNDPLVTLSLNEATEMFRAMLAENRTYLLYYCN